MVLRKQAILYSETIFDSTKFFLFKPWVNFVQVLFGQVLLSF